MFLENNNSPQPYYSQNELRNVLRTLWNEKNMWTRFYLVSKLAQLPDSIIVSNRIYETAIGIANIFRIYYGANTGNRIEEYLREDISKTISYIDNLSASNKELLPSIKTKWTNNGSEFSRYLASINPFLDEKQINNMISQMILLTIHQADKRIEQDYVIDITQYDLIEYLSNSFADYLWKGLLQQFYY